MTHFEFGAELRDADALVAIEGKGEVLVDEFATVAAMGANEDATDLVILIDIAGRVNRSKTGDTFRAVLVFDAHGLGVLSSQITRSISVLGESARREFMLGMLAESLGLDDDDDSEATT